MSKFVKHESCPSCGSRDNLARYSDGSAYCFGCRYTERGTTSPFVKERDGKTEESTDQQRLRLNGTTVYRDDAVAWLKLYGLSVHTAISAGFLWDDFREQLLMPFFEEGQREPCCIQAKNFNYQRASKAKYYNVGDKSNHWTIYGGRRSGVIVLTEDALSALKVSSVADAMPLLGVHIARDKLMRLRRVYSRLIVWLDEDKWKESRDIAEAGKFLGFDATTILTDKDPKEYSHEQIMEYLK